MTNLDWTIDGDYLSATHGIRYVISHCLALLGGHWKSYFCSDWSHGPTTDVIASSRHVFLLLLVSCRCVTFQMSSGDVCRMAVLNDFEANGYGVTALDEKHLVVLNDVLSTEKVRVSSHLERKSSEMAVNIVSPAAQAYTLHCQIPGVLNLDRTLRMQQRCRARRLCSGLEQGLGEAQLFWDEIQGGYKVWPSEGSHSGFAPRGWKQRALQARLVTPGALTWSSRGIALSVASAERQPCSCIDVLCHNDGPDSPV